MRRCARRASSPRRWPPTASRSTAASARPASSACSGRGDGPTIGLRADMDALPMEERTNLPYRSTNPNRFHGCGHDGHTTMLLGAARHLASLEGLRGNVVFVFQPAEEGLGGGARHAGRRAVRALPVRRDLRPAQLALHPGRRGRGLGRARHGGRRLLRYYPARSRRPRRHAATLARPGGRGRCPDPGAADDRRPQRQPRSKRSCSRSPRRTPAAPTTSSPTRPSSPARSAPSTTTCAPWPATGSRR